MLPSCKIYLKRKEDDFICALYADDVSGAYYIASDGKMIGEHWTANEVEGSGRGLICDAALYLYRGLRTARKSW
jgi:hypothetical protein